MDLRQWYLLAPLANYPVAIFLLDKIALVFIVQLRQVQCRMELVTQFALMAYLSILLVYIVQKQMYT